MENKTIYKIIAAATAIVFVIVIAAGGGSPPPPKVGNSKFDGSVYQVERHIKEILKDPDSYEGKAWGKVEKGSDGTYKVWHKFTAKNSFGGTVINVAIVTLDSEGNIIKYICE